MKKTSIQFIIVMLCLSVIVIKCKKAASAPKITISSITDITSSSATCGGNVSEDGGAEVTSRGVVWSTSPNPTTGSDKTTNGKGVGAFTSNITGLTPNTKYYVRAYAANSAGEVYSSTLTFTSSFGGANLALKFDGVDDFVEIPHKSNLNLTSYYTLEAWIKITNYKQWAGIISKYQNTGANGYTLRLSGTAPFDEINFDGLETSGLNISKNVWHHIAASNSSGNRLLYVDGIQVALYGTADFYNAFSNSDPIRIGSDYSSRYFDGTIDEVRVWNIVRTPLQITDNKNVSLDGVESGLVYYLPFLSYGFASGSNSGVTEATDITPTSNKGTLKNFSLSGSNSNWVTNVVYPTDITLKIGDNISGGVIAYLDATNRHGLIATSSDQSSGIVWSIGSNVNVNAGTSFGVGRANTNSIVSNHGVSSNYAALICYDLVYGGFNDWYLPSLDELNFLYTNRNGIGGFSGNAYWSSSQAGSVSTAFGVYFGTGGDAGKSFSYTKSNNQRVRPVRTF